MSKNFFKKSGLVALVGTLLGCTQKYPQYSGKYKLDITGVEYGRRISKEKKNGLERLKSCTGWNIMVPDSIII